MFGFIRIIWYDTKISDGELVGWERPSTIWMSLSESFNIYLHQYLSPNVVSDKQAPNQTRSIFKNFTLKIIFEGHVGLRKCWSIMLHECPPLLSQSDHLTWETDDISQPARSVCRAIRWSLSFLMRVLSVSGCICLSMQSVELNDRESDWLWAVLSILAWPYWYHQTFC